MALRRGRRQLLASGVGVYLLAAGCTAGQGVPREHASVLVVTLSSVRADHVEPYGAHQASTPTLRRLANEGVVFHRAYSASPFTGPSTATLLTGLNPPAHGLREDAGGRVPDDVSTLAERLREGGYLTTAFTGSPEVEARWGLDQGFSVYVDASAEPGEWLDASEVVDSAINRLYRADGPVFAWVELPLGAEPRPLDGEGWADDDAYDAQIAAVDAELGRLVSWWDRAFPDSVLVVVGDHGATLGDGDEPGGSALLTDATLRVPLVLRTIGAASGRVPVGEAVRDPVGVVDVAPTVLALADLRPPREMEGDDLLDDGSDEIYSESVRPWSQLGLASLESITLEDGRYVEGAWGAFYPVFGDRVSREADPSRPVSDLAELLAERRGDMDARVADEVSVGLGRLGGDLISPPGRQDPRNAPELLLLLDEVQARLDADQLWAAEQRLRELETLTDDAWGTEARRAQLALRQGRLTEAAVLLAGLYQRQPLDELALQIGDTLSSAGRWEEAAAWYNRVLTSQPDQAAALSGRIRVAVALGELDEAEVLLAGVPERAGPELDVARAELLLAEGRASEALPIAEAALSAQPTSASALAALASARWQLGQPDIAIDLMEEAISANRYDLGLRARLAPWLMERGRPDDAARLMAPAAQLAPAGGVARDLYDATRRAAGEGWPG